AAYKAALLLRSFTEAGHEVRVVPTPGALHFVGAATFEALSGNPVTTDVWSDVPEVAHVRIGQQADLVVVAPATADLLARAAAGGADEPLDPVRFLGNRSSGKQGWALARVAAARGAEVTLVAANVDLPAPFGVRVVPVGTAEELRTAMLAETADAGDGPAEVVV